ncbi:hypothetical protein NONO_c73470 [Nocardia nova SH22a]|uniref:Uncharacterized protein n=1 Tax=Nocardia nova SH22a TaxID=1415166 RepID=W5TT54_9NOCA|nr:hypothetical protein [Nocardia nova]AHH22103.1 hypothetical protein NONO_c73470 [Nocardia nova SH22a]
MSSEPDYARGVMVDVDRQEIHIDGAEFPWFFGDMTPTILQGPDGEPIPGLTLTIACADLTVISSGKVVPDGG